MKNWWLSSGKLLLRGVEGDPENPILLPDTHIVHFFHTIPASVTAYHQVKLILTPPERVRIEGLLTLSKSHPLEPKTFHDREQQRWNQAGIRTVGRYGATRRGGNV